MFHATDKPKPEHFLDTSLDDGLRVTGHPRWILRKAHKVLRNISSVEDWRQVRSEIYDICFQIERLEKMRGKQILHV